MSYKVYSLGLFRGERYKSASYSEYRDRIDGELLIFDADYTKEQIEDIEEALKLSLENNKDFYTNAKDYIQKAMEKHEEDLEAGVLF